jgi:hypothetical protein
MSGTKRGRAVTLKRLGEVVDGIKGVDLRDLPPFTTLLVRTVNSVYRVVLTPGPKVYVQGGAFFPDPTSAYVDGASIGGSCVKVGWIGLGLLVQFRTGDRCVITSPVRGITTEQASVLIVH